MEHQSPLRSFAALLAGSGFVAVIQLSPSRDLSASHILAIHCFAFAIPVLAGFYLIGIRLHSGSDWVDLIWQLLYRLGFVSSLAGLTILFWAIDSKSAVVFGGMLCLLGLIWSRHLVSKKP
jgi:hypothetical protein